jgi:hypothetical protein
VTGGNFDENDPEAAGVLDLHLGQAAGLRSWLPQDRDCGRSQPGVLGVNIVDLDPDHHRGPGGSAECPDISSSPLPRKNTSPGSSGGPNSRQMAKPSRSR